jgi:hypothetical protein
VVGTGRSVPRCRLVPRLLIRVHGSPFLATRISNPVRITHRTTRHQIGAGSNLQVPGTRDRLHGARRAPVLPFATGQPLIPLVLTVIAALIALAFWWGYRRSLQSPRASPVRATKRPPGDFRCVELRHESDACDAVRRLEEMRFLSGKAPEIPVPGCDAAKCSCRYVHHADRRHRHRRNPVAYYPKSAAGGERRIKRDRRRPAKSVLGPKTGR